MKQVAEDAYCLTGYFENLEPNAEDTDYWALDNGYASVTPVQLDMTAYSLLKPEFEAQLSKEILGTGTEKTNK